MTPHGTPHMLSSIIYYLYCYINIWIDTPYMQYHNKNLFSVMPSSGRPFASFVWDWGTKYRKHSSNGDQKKVGNQPMDGWKVETAERHAQTIALFDMNLTCVTCFCFCCVLLASWCEIWQIASLVHFHHQNFHTFYIRAFTIVCACAKICSIPSGHKVEKMKRGWNLQIHAA